MDNFNGIFLRWHEYNMCTCMETMIAWATEVVIMLSFPSSRVGEVWEYLQALYHSQPKMWKKGRDWYYLCLTEFYPKSHCVVPESIHTPHIEGFCLNFPPYPSLGLCFLLKKNWALETLLPPLSISINLP